MVTFPEQFLWGTGTYAYQVEGAATEEGRGESIWDRFCATPGKVLNHESGLVACDHYHRYREDVHLLKALGMRAYCCSVAWPRIMPDGTGKVNLRGLDFYDRLIDAILEAGIEPFVTLYHWDLPQALQDRAGGWFSRETAWAFADYTDRVSRRLGDRVRNWLTLNEPAVTAFDGNESGVHAPGLQDTRLAWQTSHHFLLAHGLAVPILKANGRADTRVGITLNFTALHPATSSLEDLEAVRFLDGKLHRWFLDPIFRGEYPADILNRLGELIPKMEPGDLAIIAQPLDYLGAKYYTRSIISHRAWKSGTIIDFEVIHEETAEYTDLGWEVYPQGLYEILTRLHYEYAHPEIYVIENGAAFPDIVSSDGCIHDPRRISFLREHLLQAHAAVVDGVPLRGYFAWSLIDNFEWSFGYSKRFGIVYVDYPTQQRIIKESGYWYRNVIATNEVS